METAITSTLPWTGERMVPHAADIATELFHWQRYLYFRPCYQGARVIDAASGEGYGTNYASVFAQSAIGIDIADEATRHGNARYPGARFTTADVCEQDYSDADLVLSFETIEHLADPVKFLRALATCPGSIVISTPNRNTHSPGNKKGDKPLNPYHTIEWTPSEFAELIQEYFQGRRVRFLSQDSRWPGLIREGFDEEATYCIAVIGDLELPQWPKIGVSIATHNNWNQLNDTIHCLTRSYPGEMRIAVVANGCNEATLVKMREVQAQMPYLLHVIEEPKNHGFGLGNNIGLDFLRREGGYDYYAVANDDIIATTDCVCEMVATAEMHSANGVRVGVVGPVSNAVNGTQLVDIGTFTDFPTLAYRAEQHHRRNHGSSRQVPQLRGLFMLITPNCLDSVGGFDPRFGLGNFEDDDHNLRCTLAGFSLYVADGAFLFHHGSSTFRKLDIDYQALILENRDIMCCKWGLARVEDWASLTEAPAGIELHVSLGRPIGHSTGPTHECWSPYPLRERTKEIRRAVIEDVEGCRLSA